MSRKDLIELSKWYYSGLFGPCGEQRLDINYQEALECFIKVENWTYVGLMYESGFGVEKDGQKAIEYFTKAEDWSSIAYLYRDGEVIEKDIDKAIEYFSRIPNFISIGEMYLAGKGVEENPQKAVEYFIRDVEENHSQDAAVYLWIMYDEGIGVDKDDVKAHYWRKIIDD